MLRLSLLLAWCAFVSLGQRGGTVAGKVVAQGSGRPLEASVMLVSAGTGVQVNSVRADPHGTFTIQAPVRRATIVAHAEGYASEQAEVDVSQGGRTATVSFVLRPAGSLSGRVVDSTGNAVGGARVWLQYRGDAQLWRSSDEVGGEETDASGLFHIPVVAQGKPFVLYADADGWLMSASQTMNLRSPRLTDVLLLLSRRGTTVSGRVIDSAGRPVADAEVHFRANPADQVFSPEQRRSIGFARSMHRSVRTLEDGSFVFRGVPAGRVVVAAQAGNLRGGAEIETASDLRVDLILR